MQLINSLGNQLIQTINEQKADQISVAFVTVDR